MNTAVALLAYDMLIMSMYLLGTYDAGFHRHDVDESEVNCLESFRILIEKPLVAWVFIQPSVGHTLG